MLFDWAAQPFFTVITTFIFGPYFVSRMTSDQIAAQATAIHQQLVSTLASNAEAYAITEAANAVSAG